MLSSDYLGPLHLCVCSIVYLIQTINIVKVHYCPDASNALHQINVQTQYFKHFSHLHGQQFSYVHLNLHYYKCS